MALLGPNDSPALEGMRRMLQRRAELVERGVGMIGWKLGFGAPMWLEKFGLSGPLVGYLPRSGLHPSGATVSCHGWTRPVAEPEIAVHLERDVTDPSDVGRAVGGLGAAIELADVDPPPVDIAQVLAGNIFHRAVVLGQPDASYLSSEGMRAVVSKNGSSIEETEALEAMTGSVISILAHTARLLEAVGERLRAGEVVILGSVVAPISIEPGDEVQFELVPLAPISVTV